MKLKRLERKKHYGFLKEKLKTFTRVNRDNNWKNLDSTEIVKDDIIYLKTGDIVPADCTILDGATQVNESQVTGESADVLKAKMMLYILVHQFLKVRL